MKNVTLALLMAVALISLPACSTPEEKAVEYIDSGAVLFAEGKLRKAEIEYKNALQINQNLVAAWFGLAQIHERKQEWRKTYNVLNKIKELDPKHVDGRVKLGQILLASNQLDQALLDAKDILMLAPNDARAHSLMAAVQYRLDNHDGARLEVDKALKIDANNSEAQLVLARIHISQKNYDNAHKVLDKAIKATPDNISMYLMKIQAFKETQNLEGIESIYLRLSEMFPEKLAYQHSLASFYGKNNKIDKAESVYRKIVADNPDNVDEHLRFVGFTNQHRSIEKSIALLNDYIKQDSGEFRYKFALGLLYERNESMDKAMAIYREIIATDELQTNGIKARNALALIELRSNNRDKAEVLVNEILAHDKNNEYALLIQSSFKLTDKAYDDAVVDLRTVLRDNPKSVKALSLLARAYEEKGSKELALENYIKAFRLSPGLAPIANQLAVHYVRNMKNAQADEVLEESLARGNRSITALKLLAQVKLSLQEWDAAEKIAKLLQKVEGQESLSQQVLGIVYQGKQRHSESIEAFKKAYELSPSSTQPIVALVRTYMRSGKIENAKSFLHSVLSVHADNVTAYTLLGQLSLYEKRPEKAEEYFRKSIEVKPKQTTGYRTLARVYLLTDQPDKAEKVLNEGLLAVPGNPSLTMSLAAIYEKQKNFDKAIETYSDLLEKSPELIIVKNNLASLLTDHRTDKASLEKARKIAAEFKHSKIPHFRDTYAWTQVNAEQQLEQAVSILEGVVKEVDKTPIFRYHLGKAYEKKGDNKNAISQLELAIELGGVDIDFYDDAMSVIESLK
ncbi:MAG: tetratricopeptide repeat protein [Gammaproteobacteria bacterium]|nr:tetratricopeptide repeat protein [Gammaproteobacteria bacterium]